MPLYMICNGACINGYGFVAIHFATKKIVEWFAENSLGIRWEFVDLDDFPTKFRRNSNDLFCGKMLWQNVLPQTKISLKCWCCSISGVWQNVLPQDLLPQKKKPLEFRENVVWKAAKTTKSQRNPNEILMKF